MSKTIDFFIKYVYPDWFGENDRDKSVGFHERYKNKEFAIGGKMLIYVVEHQIIVGAYHVVGKFFREKGRQHPLRLPIKKIYCIQDNNGMGLGINEIRPIVSDFHPNHVISYHEITEDQYSAIETLLLK